VCSPAVPTARTRSQPGGATTCLGAARCHCDTGLAIDRTTALCGAGYEWGIHIAVYAGKAGLTDEQVASLATGDPADACWTDPADSAVLATVDALHQRADLDDAEWQTLLDAVGEDAAVDLLLLCGWYHAISFAVNALRLPAEPGTPALPGRSR
jgi:hypothetical protein